MLLLMEVVYAGRAVERSGDRHQGSGRSGRRCRIRLSRRRRPADLRCAVQAELTAPHPGAARAGRGARGRGLCPLDRAGRGRARDERSGRDQCGHRLDRRADGLGADRLPDRPGPDAPDRQRRVPGSRHDRHHAALHKAQLSRQGRPRTGPHTARGLLCREERPPGAGRRRSAEGRPVRARPLHARPKRCVTRATVRSCGPIRPGSPKPSR